jgi:hypothetical protein
MAEGGGFLKHHALRGAPNAGECVQSSARVTEGPILCLSAQTLVGSFRPVPGFGERLHSSDDRAAWKDRHGEGFRMPSGVGKPPKHEPAGLW